MNIYIAHLLLFVSFFSAQTGRVEAKDATKKTAEGQFLMIDNFDTPSDKKYVPFRGVDTVISTLGYGIYFRKADAQLSIVPLNDADKALRIQYGLPLFFSWGNWLSIRKEFKSSLDLSGEHTGLELDINVEIPSNAFLRITLADVENLKDAGKHGADELWWFDFDPGVLENRTKKWFTLRAPFKEFSLSYGEGTRHNDGKLELSKIVAYELNLISKSEEYPKGAILINSLRAFKNKK